MTETALRSRSPFHSGEIEIQQRLGIHDKMDKIGRRVIRDHLIDQHRDFYRELPYLLVGASDEDGRPWVSFLTGEPGFLSSPDPHSLVASSTLHPSDPLATALVPGTNVGILGIQTETRRRNRMTGIIAKAEPDKLSISVKQSFGNCPQYIQARDTLPNDNQSDKQIKAIVTEGFGAELTAFIEAADTFFIATSHSESNAGAGNGADVSHRGGRPGFIKVENDTTFIFPDFRGNFFFNTLGNIHRNPRTGISFIDYETGGLTYLTGTSEIIWEGPEVSQFEGAQRFVRFRADKIVQLRNALPFRFDFKDYSPTLKRTGLWPAG